jgi:hypothetical protein
MSQTRKYMTESEVSKPEPVTSGSSKATVGRLIVLDLGGSRPQKQAPASHFLSNKRVKCL